VGVAKFKPPPIKAWEEGVPKDRPPVKGWEAAGTPKPKLPVVGCEEAGVPKLRPPPDDCDAAGVPKLNVGAVDLFAGCPRLNPVVAGVPSGLAAEPNRELVALSPEPAGCVRWYWRLPTGAEA